MSCKSKRIAVRTPEEFRLLRAASFTGFVLLILDQLTKILVEQLMVPGRPLPVIDGFFSLTYVTNKGAAWGMFSGYGMALFAVGVLVTITAIYFLRNLCEGYRERYFAILVVISGVVGNSIDRIWRGEVVDFLDFYIKSYHWPAFNVADCAICIGIAVYTFSVLFRPTEKAAEKPADKLENAR